MNLQRASSSLKRYVFKLLRLVASFLPVQKISAFGYGQDKIGSILVINLDRQPLRWRQVIRELGQFCMKGGEPLVTMTRRLSAIDARDGCAVAATADVDPLYKMEDQLFVLPDPRLEECFGANERIRMSRQEVAVARSHIEAWKCIASGKDNYVLILEDDIWFRPGAASAIDRGWEAALARYSDKIGPHLLYLSYSEAQGKNCRSDVCDLLFRPLPGLLFLSGYILSREGAAKLLRAMPVVGPVDLWINYRFSELRVFALSSPVIMQREDSPSDNSYSILPYLARAGIVDASSGPMRPHVMPSGLVLAWTSLGKQESLAMALSMLGLRVRVFDGSEDSINAANLFRLGKLFDALIDAPLSSDAIYAVGQRNDVDFFWELGAENRFAFDPTCLPKSRTTIFKNENKAWKPLCDVLGMAQPVQAYPTGASRCLRLFRDDRPSPLSKPNVEKGVFSSFDDSPWVLPSNIAWQPSTDLTLCKASAGEPLIKCPPGRDSAYFFTLVETFPGNLASFARDGVISNACDTQLVVSKGGGGNRPFRSGAFASVGTFCYGRFEVEIKAAQGDGLITGFFLHRDSPRQEIDIELPGGDQKYMLVNVYFNPGDDGSALSFGYRGTPCRIGLDFSPSLDFHRYAIEWRAGHIDWIVDGRIVHRRVGWDPTPIPHLPMRLYANLWVPRSEELAGRLDEQTLPAAASFKNVAVWN